MKLECLGYYTPCKNPMCSRQECRNPQPEMDEWDKFLAGITAGPDKN